MSRELTIDSRRIADDEPAYLIAETHARERHHPTYSDPYRDQDVQAHLLGQLVDEVRVMNHLLESIASSMSENRSDDDA